MLNPLSKNKWIKLVLAGMLAVACQDSPLDVTLEWAGDNRAELEKVLVHYADDSLKRCAAEYLISYMADKYYYTGEQLDRYEYLLLVYDSLRRNEQILTGDPPAVKEVWNELNRNYGTLSRRNLQREWDCQTLTADFLIENIDYAFAAWESTPALWRCNFEQFCEYVLPYRVGEEEPEPYRKVHYERYKGIRDTVHTDSMLMVAMNDQFFWKEHYRSSDLMWSFPLELSVSRMELGRRGSCRHMSNYCTHVMRAMGFPVAIDYVKCWGNRSKGHSWNVLIRPDGSSFPFDAFGRDSLVFAYKPAKIFRKVYARNREGEKKSSSNDVPWELSRSDEVDVTHLYGKTFDIAVECSYPYTGKGRKQYGVICVFDNRAWQPVWWGRIEGGKMHFENMMGDVCYMAAYYDEGMVMPACEPFILTKEGEQMRLVLEGKADMRLLRKYPRFERMNLHAMNLRRSRVEASNDAAFRDTTLLFDMYNTPHDVNDSIVTNEEKFRYVRWNIVSYRTGDLAEVAFYGKQGNDSIERKLEGTIIGTPIPTDNTEYPYHNAMDGDPATFFSKPKETVGYVGLDLGKGKEARITRVHFHPRSDTNYILIGDTYELCYWDCDHWVSAGTQVATEHELTFKNVPQGTFYILHDLTKGKEERIFTYENGEQVWW